MRELYHTVREINPDCRITIDLGLVNKTDYYTGLVMKGYLEGYGEEVLSGGRYDKLLSEFGYDIPAVGMAVNVDAVADVIGKKNPPVHGAPDVLIASEEGYEAQAVRKASELRAQGLCVEHSLFTDFELSQEYAKDRKIGRIILISAEQTEELEVKIDE